jgi:predicted  nucleic acid-binding Zn-ribbon protein
VTTETESTARQTLDQLTGRYQALHKKQIQAETELQTANEQLDKLRQRAQAEFGTDDLDALTAKLAELQAENETRRATYQKDLDAIEQQLADVEQRLATETTDETGADTAK